MYRINVGLAVGLFLSSFLLPSVAVADADVPLVRVRLIGTQSTSLQDKNYNGFQFGAQLHPTFGRAGSPHLDRLFVGARLGVSPGDSRELERVGGIVGYQSPDLSSGFSKHVTFSGSAGLSLESYDLFIDSPEAGEFEGDSTAQGVVVQAQLNLWRFELGLSGEYAYLFAAEETSHSWGITLGFTLF